MTITPITEKYVNISTVEIPPRQRKTFTDEALSELAESIANHGLFHAPVLSEGFVLIAGWRRIQAMKALHLAKRIFTYNSDNVPENCIPFISIQRRDQIHALEMELDENLIREDITWQDKVRAQSEIHKLRSARNENQTYKKTAEEIVARTGSGSVKAIQADISRAMVTSEFLDHPDVKSAKNERWAFNAATKILRDEFTSKLGTRVKSRHTFLAGDTTKILPQLVKKKEKFNCFIVDPPYGINAQDFHIGNSPQPNTHEYVDDKETAIKLSRKLIVLCSKLAHDSAHMWMFCDVESFIELRDFMASNNWICFRTPLIWSKGSTGFILRTSNIRRGHEMLIFGQRSAARGLSQVTQDVITISSREEEKLHAAQKPVALYEQLIRVSCLPNDRVLDPVCGSGTIFHAAQSSKVSATGVEQDKNFIAICQNLLVELETR